MVDFFFFRNYSWKKPLSFIFDVLALRLGQVYAIYLFLSSSVFTQYIG